MYTAQPTPQPPRNEIISAMGCRVVTWVDQSVMGVGRATDNDRSVLTCHMFIIEGAVDSIFHSHDTQDPGSTKTGTVMLYSCIQLYLSPETLAARLGG